MAKITFIVKYITILFLLSALLPIITTSYPVVQERKYEGYCLTALSYILSEEQSKKLPFKNFEEFINSSIEVDTWDPVGFLKFAHDQGDGRVHARIGRVYEHLDVAFYYTIDKGGQKSEFFGCALLPSDSPKGLRWSDIVVIESRQKIGRIMVDNITFNRVDYIVKYSNSNGSFNWGTNTTILILYDSNSLIAKGWDAYISWIGTNPYGERELVKDIIEDRTIRIETPARLEERQARLDEIIHSSQIIIAVLVGIMIMILLVERKREIDKWRV
ncbi:MAG: hypothetical protein DRO89_00025 [Candidatus Altiarchaeales archaeon]|nr:MAG: hypothetical protein DRO89_00025 [Candidatus Altiarchaeales archaeon]